ncbi:hypothetical protein BgiBS90_018774, partial [Biomphalaria glabrata]
ATTRGIILLENYSIKYGHKITELLTILALGHASLADVLSDEDRAGTEWNALIQTDGREKVTT